LTEEWVKPHLAFVLNQQTESGAFNTATGFGRRGEVARPDWRDMLPACGWADKVYHLLAVLNPGSLVLAPTGDVRRAVTIRGRPAVFEESVGGMRLTSPVDNVWFDWRKGTKWPLKSML
jgi:hypothetical protein